MLRSLREDLGTLLFAFVLALTVWAASINLDDPSLVVTLEEGIPIQYLNLPAELLIVGEAPSEAIVTVRAPQSVIEELAPQDLSVFADLTELTAGTFQVRLNHSSQLRPLQITSLEPNVVTLTVEPSSTKELPVQVTLVGQPALGFEAEDPRTDVSRATVFGPESAVNRLVALRASITITNRQEGLEQLVSLDPIDEDGMVVEGIQVMPATTLVAIDIRLQVNYRLVSVIPIIEGQAELELAGYRVTEFSVTPSLVTIYSSDPQAFAELPGFVETVPLNLAGVTDDIERRLPLNLPAGFSPVGDPSVTVKVTIEPRLNSITITRRVDVQGLGPDLYALPSPETVNLILTGPAATLEDLQDDELLIVVDLLDLGVGTHQVTPQVIGLPTGVVAGDPVPASIQVTITTTPPPTPTPSPGP
jgi:YbbR domain-containing protein